MAILSRRLFHRSEADQAGSQSANGEKKRQSFSSDVYRRNSKGDAALRLPSVTMRVIVMAALVAMGGFIFGYDTGQISGFLEMNVFLERFGEPTSDLTAHPSGFRFSNVRAGLIVGLVGAPQ